MKKFLLLVAAATLTLGATAATPKLANLAKKAPQNMELQLHQGLFDKSLSVTNHLQKESKIQAGALRAKAAVTPEGTPSMYMLNDYYMSDIPVNGSFSDDSTKVFFDNMFPYILPNGEAWFQGNISTDGNSVVFPMDLYVIELTDSNSGTTYQCAPCELVVEGETIVDVKDLVLVKDGNNFYIDDDEEAPSRIIALGAFLDGVFQGQFDYTYILSYTPFEGNTDLVELPEGAQPSESIYYYDYGYPRADKGQVYVDGNDVYMNLLAAGFEAWVKGTKEGNTVTFKGDQYVGENGGYLLYFNPFYTDGSSDEQGYLYTFPCDYMMTYDPETDTYTAVAEEGKDIYTGVLTYSGLIYDYALDFVVTPFTGIAPAIPSDPEDLEISDDLYDWLGQYEFFYSIYNIDVDGKYMDPENLGYYIYMDGEPYTLTPDMFVKLTEDMDLIPYTFTDNYDIYPDEIYIGETLFTTLGVQVVNNVDGVINYSNVVSVDMEGNVTTEPAPQVVVGLNNVTAKQITSVAIYDAEGRKLDAAQKGVNVVKMVAADGSVKTVKMFKK
jgi:hypothetical protein